MENSITIFEFDTVYSGDKEDKEFTKGNHGHYSVDTIVFDWLSKMCLGDNDDENAPAHWLKIKRVNNKISIQFAGFVGVLRAPNGFQIEVLPKTGKNIENKDVTRLLLVKMLKCLSGFRHLKTYDASLKEQKMPLLEVFIQQFLLSVEAVVKRGLRSDYVLRQDNLFALRGKLLMAQHIKQNIVRRDRFFTEHDEFSPDRAENRLLYKAILCVLKISRSADNQKVARELRFVFNDIPESSDINKDFSLVRKDRGMGYYEPALDWARLILNGYSPLTGFGNNGAISLMFPMAKIFEAYVAKHLRRRLNEKYNLKEQACSEYLVEHSGQSWFRLKPDMLIQNKDSVSCLVMDTKWKLIDSSKLDRKNKYDLSESDFYQLYAYGQNYLNGKGDMILIFPRTERFNKPLPVFQYLKEKSEPELRLWVVPFCLEDQKLSLPVELTNNYYFEN